MSSYVEYKNGEGLWKYYLREAKGQSGKCKECLPKVTIIKTAGGSTHGLHVHLQTQHKINLLKRKVDDDTDITDSTVQAGSQPTMSSSVGIGTMMKYMTGGKKEEQTMAATIARMTACDGLSFCVFATSSDLHRALLALGHQVPKSENSVKKLVMEHGKTIKASVVSELAQRKIHGERFSVTLDEWMSTRNRRYMNINVHGQCSKIWSLGLVRVHGSMPAERCVELLEQRLSEFGLSLKDDIVAICTDGASVMTTVGKIIDSEQQLCYAHGIQLAVLDVLYSRPVTAAAADAQTVLNDDSGDDDDEDDDDDEKGGLEVSCDEFNLVAELSDEYAAVVVKVRKVVKIFRRSPTKNDVVLQKHVTSEFGREMSVILDCRTRWSSLLNMLSRFLQLRTAIQKSLIDLRETHVQLIDADFLTIQEMVS